MTWEQTTISAVPGARIATGQPHDFIIVLYFTVPVQSNEREKCASVCAMRRPLLRIPGSPATTWVRLPTISWITSAGNCETNLWRHHSPNVICQPSAMERSLLSIHNEGDLEVVDTWYGSRYKEKLVGSSLNWVWLHIFVANRFFPLIPKAIGLYFIFLQSIFLGSTT